MSKYLIIIEKTGTGYSAYSPDLPGCAATGASRIDAEKNMYDAIQMHIEGLREDGLPIPESTAFAEYMLIGASAR